MGCADDAAGGTRTLSSEALLDPVWEFAWEEEEADCCSENWSTQLAPNCDVDPSIRADWEWDKSEKVSLSVLRDTGSTAIPAPELISEEGAGTTNSRLEDREESEGGMRGDVGDCASGWAYGFGGYVDVDISDGVDV